MAMTPAAPMTPLSVQTSSGVVDLFPKTADPDVTTNIRRPGSDADDLRQFSRFLISANVFCPTGPGGGIDPTCSPGGGGGSSAGGAGDSSHPPPLRDHEVAAFVERNGLKNWRPTLTPDEKHAVDRHQANNAGTNIELRGSGAVDRFTADQAVHLDQALSKAPPLKEPVTVLRGLQFEDESAAVRFLANARIGDTFIDHGYPSTSLSSDYMDKFFGRDFPENVKLEIRVPAGTKAAFLGGGLETMEHERELLLPRGSRFKVVEKRSFGQAGLGTHLVVEYVGTQPRDLTKPLTANALFRGKGRAEQPRRSRFLWRPDDLAWEA